MSQVTLQIGGRDYVVACAPGEEDHVAHLGSVIHDKLADMPPALASNEPRVMLFAALLLADEVVELRLEAEAAAQALQERDAKEQAAREKAQREKAAAEKAASEKPAPDDGAGQRPALPLRAHAPAETQNPPPQVFDRLSALAERLERLAQLVEAAA